MSLQLFLHHALRWALFVVLPAGLIAGAGYELGRHQTQVFRATTTLYVEPGQVTASTAENTSSVLTQTYSATIGSPAVLSGIDKRMQAKYPGYAVELHSLQASQPLQVQPSSLIFISVDDTNPFRAKAAADTAARVFIARMRVVQSQRFAADAASLARQVNAARADIARITAQINAHHGNAGGLKNLRLTLETYQQTYQSLLTSQEQFAVMRDGALPSLTILAPAGASQIEPMPRRYAIIAGLLALVIFGAGLATYDYLDDTIDPDQLESIAGAPVLGTIQRFRARTPAESLVTARKPNSQIADAYRIIRTNIQFTSVDRPPRSILVTSARPEEGKSTTAGNLAQVFAEGGQPVTLVDADLRRPNLHRIFGHQMRPGLTNLLLQDRLNGHAERTGQENLMLIASGELPPNPADLLRSDRMKTIIDQVAQSSEILMIDSPPVLAVTDAAILATMTDGVVLVLDPDTSKTRDVARAREAIEAVGGKIIGVVVNRVSRRGAGYYYYHYGYGYGYNYSSKSSRKEEAPQQA